MICPKCDYVFKAEAQKKGGENSKRTDMKGADSPGQIAAQKGREKARKARLKEKEDFVMPDGWSAEIPTEEGAYWMICMETNHVKSPVEIRLEEGELIADDVYLGVVPLEHFHNGLTDIYWKGAMSL